MSKLLSWPGLKSALAGVMVLGMAACSSAAAGVIPLTAPFIKLDITYEITVE